MSKPTASTSPKPPDLDSRPGPGQAPSSGTSFQLPSEPVWSEDGHTVTDAKGRRYTRLSASTDYDDLSPKVQALPTECKGARHNWWNSWASRFGSKIRNRGSGGMNGRSWTFGIFVTCYCDEFHPHLTPEERCEYKTVLAPNIYYYMFNSRKRSSTKTEPDDNDEDILLPSYKGPTRVTATYLWQKENEEKVRGLLEEYFAKNPNIKHNAGQRNAAIQKLYKLKVPEADRAQYNSMVDEENQNIKAGIRLDGEPLVRYVKRLPGTLQKALNNAHAIGGVHIMLTMVLESPDKPGNFEIHAISTEDMKAFQKEKCVAKSMTAMREFIRQSHGESTGGLCGPPSPEVYPNRRGAWEPLLPNPEGLRAFELLSLNRGFWKRFWAYMGGDCRFPWTEIAKEPHLWLGGGPEELPGPLGDPSSLGGPINKAWVGFFYGHQTGIDLSSEKVFLRRILSANPIDPSESEEVSRERYTYNGQEVWLLTFDKPVSKCHARKMEWSQASIEYADYMENSQTTSSLMVPNPLGLPAAPTSQTNKVLIRGDMLDDIIFHTDQLPNNSTSKLVILDLVRAYNEFAVHLPAETEKGAWSEVTPPLILPPKPKPIFNIFRKRYLPPSFFQSVLLAAKEGTLSYTGAWFELITSCKLLWHEKSLTLLGGNTGVIWAVVALIFLVFNFNYACGDVPLPAQLPESYDLSRLSASEAQHAIDWCQALIQKLRESEAILRGSSSQRLRIAPPTSDTSEVPVSDLNSEETAPLQLSARILLPVATPKSASATKLAGRIGPQQSPSNKKITEKKPLGKKGSRKKSKRSRKNSSESESEAEFTDEDSDEQNYEEDSNGSDTSEDGEPAGFAGNDLSQPDDGIRPPSPPAPILQEDSSALDDATSLFRKYSSTREGSTGRNRTKKDEGYVPLIRDTTLKAADCPWGRFPDPDINATLPSPLRLETLKPRMESTLIDLCEVITNWKKAVEDTEKAQTQHCRQTLEAPNPAAGDPDLGPLVATVRAREAMWNFQEAQCELLFPILEQLSIISMTAVQFTLAAGELIKRSKNLIEAGIEAGSVWREFAKFDQVFRTRIAEARWIVEEMEDYALLATQQRKQIPWFPDSDKRPTFDKPAMLQLAISCMEWTKATADLEKPMLSRRYSNWSTTGRPFPTAHHEPSKYKFGNAEKREWHKDFKACIERCRALIPITTSGITAPTTRVSTTPSVARRQSPEPAPKPSTPIPVPIPKSPTAASDVGGTRRLSTAPGKAGTSSLGPDTTSPVLGSDIGQPTPREEGKSSDTTGLDESINDYLNTTGPTDATISEPEPEPDLPCRSISGSPAPVSSVLPIKAPKAKPSKGRVTKTVLLPETCSEARQTRLGAKRKAEEEATKVKRRTRSKK